MLLEIAKNHNKTAAQVALNFLTSQDIVVIPKTNNNQLLEENLNIFDFKLTQEEFGKIKTLDKNIRVNDAKYMPDMGNIPIFA